MPFLRSPLWTPHHLSLPVRWSDALRAVPPWSEAGALGFRVFGGRTTPHVAVRGFEVVGGGSEAGRRYWLKIYRREPDDAARELEWLRAASSFTGAGRGPAVVEAVAWLPALGGVVTAHVEGPTLAELLEDDAVGPERREELCREAGGLLAGVHAARDPRESDGGRGDGGEPTGERFDFGFVLAAIEREARPLPPDLRARLARALERLVARVTPADTELRPSHGDFGPFNLIASPHGLTALDPSFHRDFPRPGHRSTRAEDLARFAGCLRGVSPESFDAPERLHRVAAFFAAYRAAGGAELAAEAPAVRVMATHSLLLNLRDWASGRAKGARGPLVRRWLEELEGGGG